MENFILLLLTNGHMQADTGTKMIHIGKNTRSSIISKGISADHSSNSYRGQVRIGKNATMQETIANATACW